MDILAFIIIGSIAFWAAVGIVILIFYYRSLSLRQDGMINEIEDIAAAQRRTMEKLHGLGHKFNLMSEKLNKQEEKPDKNIELTRQEVDQKTVKEDVLFLARQGLDVKTIAKDLGVPSGEVELILDLERFSAKE